VWVGHHFDKEHDCAHDAEDHARTRLNAVLRPALPTRAPTVPPAMTPGMDHATTSRTEVAASAWIAAPTEAVMARTNTLVATATRGGTRHRTTSCVVTDSGRPALTRTVTNPPTLDRAPPGVRQGVVKR